MSNSFEIVEYSINNLKKLLEENSKASRNTINDKLHCNYFEGYFKDLAAKTILVEFRYVDHDFLEDFAGYYVKCFRDHERKCARFHFFSNSFTQKDFHSFLGGSFKSLNEHLLQKEYLGFIVVKPLPLTIIGRTCLRTYPTDSQSHTRHFPITRSYKVSLFGIQLYIETLAFQEQDKITSACATSALWSVFQGTGKLFQHEILSPVEITKAATENLPIESRAIPNHGLNAGQIAQAIRSLKLEPLYNIFTDIWRLKANIYAYLHGKIPIILVVDLYDTSISPNKYKGTHGVAISGFGLAKKPLEPFDETGMLLKAMSVDRLYVHDDQIGPFSKMAIDGKKVTIVESGNLGNKDLDSLATSWLWSSNGEKPSGRAVPQYFCIPLYNKIRIPYIKIQEKIFYYDYLLETLRSEKVLPMITERLEWDIYLSTVNDYKKQFMLNSLGLTPEIREKILTKRMARFIWIGKANLKGKAFLDLIFDATEIEQGNLFLIAIEYNNEFPSEMRKIAKLEQLPIIKDTLDRCDIMRWFNKQPDID